MKKSPAQLMRRIAMLEAQNTELQDKLKTAFAGWGDLCMEKSLRKSGASKLLLF